jgi:hypothetical protein
MTPTSALIEPSCAEAIAIIAAASELPEQTRRHWTTSLRQMAKALDRPLEVIPARYSAVRADLDQLHEAPAGLTTKTLRNHKSNAKAALLWLAREKGIPRAGAPLTPAWEELRAKLNDGIARSKLSSFMRFCAGSSIAPADVDEAVVDRFIAYRAAESLPMMQSGVCWPGRGTPMLARCRVGLRVGLSSRRSRLRWNSPGRLSLKVCSAIAIVTLRV